MSVEHVDHVVASGGGGSFEGYQLHRDKKVPSWMNDWGDSVFSRARR